MAVDCVDDRAVLGHLTSSARPPQPPNLLPPPPRDTNKAGFQSKGLPFVSRLAAANARDLLAQIHWNEAHGIRLFRLSSGGCPSGAGRGRGSGPQGCRTLTHPAAACDVCTHR